MRRERLTDRDSHKDRQTDTETRGERGEDRDRQRQTDRYRQTETGTRGERGRETETGTRRETDRQRQRARQRQRDPTTVTSCKFHDQVDGRTQGVIYFPACHHHPLVSQRSVATGPLNNGGGSRTANSAGTGGQQTSHSQQTKRDFSTTLLD